MKIVVLGTRGFPGIAGGIERHCENLYPALGRLGCHVVVLARGRYFSQTARPGSYEGVDLRYLVCPGPSSLETLLHTGLGVFIAALVRPDILHIHGIGPGVLVPLARLLGLRVVLTHHGPDYRRRQWGAFARRVLQLGERWGAGYANQVIAISRQVEGLVRGHRRSACVRIPNGVGRASKQPFDTYLNSVGLERGRYVLAVGRFVEDKGFHDLIDAFSTLRCPGMRLVLAGGSNRPTSYSRRLESMARERGVVLPGLVTGDALWRLFSHARLFVLPSHYEGFPITLLEAMSFGLDVLVSDIPAHLELGLEPSDHFPVGDVKTLAAMLSNKLAEKRSRDFSKILDPFHSWPDIAARTLAVYEAVASETRTIVR